MQHRQKWITNRLVVDNIYAYPGASGLSAFIGSFSVYESCLLDLQHYTQNGEGAHQVLVTSLTLLQANASSKRIAQSNQAALKNLQLGLIVVLVCSRVLPVLS